MRKRFKTPSREEILTGPPLRIMARIGFPAVLSAILLAVYNLTDAAWLGRLPEAGATTIAAMQVSWPIYWIVIAFALGFAHAAVTALVSQHVGAGQDLEANRAMNMLFTVVVAAGVVLGIAGFFFARPAVSFLIADADIASAASTYLRVIFLGFPTVLIPALFVAALSATGDTIMPLIVNGAGTLLNIILDPFLILGWGPFPQMGIYGAGVATVAAQGVAMLAFILLFRRGIGILRLNRDALRVRWSWMWKALRIGTPAGLGDSAMAVGFALMMKLIGGLDNGKFALAGYGAADRIFSLLFIATQGMSIGLTTMVGQALGAKLKTRARELMRKGVGALFAILIVETILLYFLRTPLVRIFIPNDPEAITEGARFIQLFAVSMPFLGLYFAADAVYNAAGWNLPMSILGVLRLAIRLSVGWLLAYVLKLQADGIWIGMAVSNAFCGLVSLPFLLSKRWQRVRIDAPEEEAETASSGKPEAEAGTD